MTSTDLALSGQQSTDLTIDAAQTTFTPAQVAALQHMGVEDASEGDLGVFFHVVKRTGLDPFARQIYMIGRASSVKDDRTNEWTKVVKQTIQTGIDGYRLIARRAADAARTTVSVTAPEWAHQDGSWRPVWVQGWGTPIAARITIERGGQPFTAVALFDEYKQTKRNGDLTSMWQQRPAGQIAKCAEALAWRMAFPQDLAGVYVEEELHHADSERVEPTSRGGADRMRAALHPEAPAEDVQDAEAEVIPAPVVEPITAGQLKALHASLKDAGLDKDRPGALALYSRLACRDVTSSKDLSRDEASWVLDALKDMAAAPEVEATLVAEPDAEPAGW